MFKSSSPAAVSVNDRQLVAPDGTRIAYRVEGSGPALVLTSGLTTSTLFWKYVRPIWLKRHTVLSWDLPGHGNSGPAQSETSASMPGQPRLIAEVMRAAGIARAAQIGWSTGSQVVLETYRQFPELCEALVLVLGGAGRTLENTRLLLSGTQIDRALGVLPRAAFTLVFHALARTFQAPGSLMLGRQIGLIGPGVCEADAREMTAHIAACDPYTLQRLTRSSQAHSAHAVLSALRVPLMIVAGDRDPFALSELVGVPLQQLAAGSQLLRLADGAHTALLEEPERIASAIERFLDGPASRSERSS